VKKLDFNQDWAYRILDSDDAYQTVTLPHDAMCTEERSLDSKGRHNIGWFVCHDYEYVKEFEVPAEYKGSRIIFEFEGVYRDARISLNGKELAYRAYGYTDFYVDATEAIRAGEKNTIRVTVKNADQPNSRWYSGTGIYRPVWMYVGSEKYIEVDGVKVATIKCDKKAKTATLAVTLDVSVPDAVTLTLSAPDGNAVATKTTTERKFTWDLEGVTLWSPKNPYLYDLTAQIGDDTVTETIGIRKLTWSPEHGMEINGRRVILKGACIHHDNGILGACTYYEAEERKVKLLMENGYNAIRSAHNPCSKDLLKACDKLGMLVMDEYVDMWYIHKNQYDYATHMQKNWKEDLKEMVEKDYNHPCVVLYSTGNEVAETGEKKGIELTGAMTEYLHGLDAYRPVSCGVNIFFNFLYSMGFGVYSDDKAEKEAKKAESDKKTKKKAVGSEFYNTLAGMFGDKSMKIGATLHMCDVKTRDSYANMDIAGYNYGIYRYKHDLKKYPNRLILGSETFCKDAYAFYELAKKQRRIIGDFVWAGMDYIGEAGIGSWEYEDYAPMETEDPGWLAAGSGRLDILGFADGEALYTRVALEKEAGPYIAVKPVYQTGKHTPSAWKMTDAKESWSWPGCEGKTASVEVYARADSVELFVNGTSAGRKKLKNKCNTTYKVSYQPGTIEAVAYDADGKEIGRKLLQSAGADTTLVLTPEAESVPKGGLVFVRLEYTDKDGIWKPMEKHPISIEVLNGELKGFGNACPYNPDGYWKNKTKTYYGRALAAVRAQGQGEVTIKVTDEKDTYTVTVPIK
jgi:beta-galactosidase